MFGSVNLMNNLYSSQFTPIDLVGVLGVNAGLTYYACESDSFRIQAPVVGEKIEEMVGDKLGWMGDARFVLGVGCAALAHFGTKPSAKTGMPMISDRTAQACHDIAAGSLSSLVATEVCRHVADKGMQAAPAAAAEGSENVHLLGADDLLFDDDLLGLEEYADEGSMNFAYGW